MKNSIKSYIKSSIDNYSQLLDDDDFQNSIERIVKKSIEAFKLDKKILLCGNGGSAADAQHIAAELSGKFYLDRPPLYAEALHVNSSYITAVANDYSYEEIYSRMVEASGRKGDILIGISTSGDSLNVINALRKGKEKEMLTIGLTGINGGRMNSICDIIIKVPSEETPRIQEAHILIGHIICQLIEEEMFVK